MSNFTARTRVRGEVTYYKANWLDSYYGDRKYGVKFVDGPHQGEVFREEDCAIAQDGEYKLKTNKGGNSGR